MKRLHLLHVLVLASTSVPAAAQDGTPGFTDTGQLLRPVDLGSWTFLSSGLGMTYGPARSEPGHAPMFTNVFVNPEAYQAFRQSGSWPEETVFVLEIRLSERDVSIDTGGQTQGSRVMLEASVKDSARFPEDGWAFFAFDGQGDATSPLPRSASCYSCHSAHGAVEWTFTQFYPDLFEIARTFGTVREDYDPARKVE